MNNKRNRKEKPSSKREKAGFYIAFSLCLAAVGMSVWSAYSGITDYFKENGDTSSSIHQQDNTENVDKNLTDITEEDTTAQTEETKPESQENITEEQQTEPQEEPSEDAAEYVTEPEQTEESETQEAVEEDIVQTILRVNKNLGYPTETKIIAKEFSENMVYDSTMGDYRAHMGIDFTCEEGEKVIAMCDATVEDNYYSEMMGNVVKVTSGEFSILYCGLDENILVTSGDTITKGQEIGTAMGVPCESADGTHIHVEIIVRNRYIDPLTVIENES